MAEWLDTKSWVKLGRFLSQFPASCVSSHTEVFRYNGTVSMCMTIYIYIERETDRQTDRDKDRERERESENLYNYEYNWLSCYSGANISDITTKISTFIITRISADILTAVSSYITSQEGLLLFTMKKEK